MSMWLPTGFSWRELWESRNISGVNWRSSVPGGQLLTMTACVASAERRSTSAGIQFVAGVTTSNVEFSDPYDAVNDWWCSLRFKLDSDFSSVCATNQFLFGKYDDVNNYITVNLRAADGKLVLTHDEGAGPISVVSAEVSWTAGVWYNVIVWISNTDTEHGILINDGVEVITADGTAISLIADMCIGAADKGVSVDGFVGVIQDVYMKDDVLTDAEKTDLFNGIPPADTINAFKFNEGAGNVANNDGSGGIADNGILDISCTWAWDGVQQPVASFAGINQYAVSAAAVDISGNLSYVHIFKVKSTYDTLSGYHQLFMYRIDVNDYIDIISEANQARVLVRASGGGTSGTVYNTILPTIDDYIIYIGTLTGGVLSLYINGVLIDTASGIGAVSPAAATLIISKDGGAAQYYDTSEIIIHGLIEGALNLEQVRAVTKNINDRLGLGVI